MPENPTPGDHPHHEKSRDLRRLAMRLSLFVSFLMLGGKWFAFTITGSRAILSDALESVVHLAATGIAVFSLWYSQQPADPQHPYGHGKIAYFSAGFEGALILTAALAIIFTAVEALIQGLTLSKLGLGIAITGGLGLINLALGTFLIRVGRQHDAVTLVANGQHVLTDTWTSFGVVLGVALVWATDFWWFDPVVAILVGAQIAWTAVALLRRSYDGLMDRVDERITRTIMDKLDEAVQTGQLESFHQLRHREVDGVLWVDVHLLLPGALPLEQAHARATAIESAVYQALPHDRVRISSHLEPADKHLDHHPAGHDQEDALGESGAS